MQKRLIAMSTILFMLIITLAIGGVYLLNQGKSNTTQTEETEVKPLYLEIHYGNGEIYKTELEDLYTSLHGAAPVATLKNGYRYRLTEYYKYEHNENTNTWIVYFWRDEPYSLEKEHFTKIQ